MTVTDLALLLARCLIAAMFVTSAVDKFRLNPAELRMIAALHLPAPAVLERATGVFEVAMAASLVLGLYTRVAALALAGFTLFVTLAFLRFWTPGTPAETRATMRNVFVANLAVVGGLIVLAAHGPGALTMGSGL